MNLFINAGTTLFEENTTIDEYKVDTDAERADRGIGLCRHWRGINIPSWRRHGVLAQACPVSCVSWARSEIYKERSETM